MPVSLKEIVDRHVHYEVAMLFSTYMMLRKGVTDGKIGNALIESFFIHARLLNEFLWSRGFKSVRASQVTEGYTPFVKRKIDERVIKKIHEQIAHLGRHHRTARGEKLINPKRLARTAMVLAEEIIIVQKHWKRRYAPRWHVVPTSKGYELHRHGRPPILLVVK